MITLLTLVMFFTFDLVNAQGIWVQQADFPGGDRVGAFSFSISGKLYVGNGHNPAGNLINDLWEYDPQTDSWSQKAAVPGNARAYGSSFTIGNYGYVGLGDDGYYADDFWRYDPSINTWTQVANLVGSARMQASGFSVGNYGYIAGGFGPSGYQTTFWQYDPMNDVWIQKSGFTGIGRTSAVGFTINGCGYLGTGWYNNNTHTNFWKYDPSIDTWTQVAPIPGSGRSDAIAFGISGFGYVGVGQDAANNPLPDFYKYDPLTDSWSPVAAIPTGRINATAVSVGNNGFVATGYNDELWKFTDTVLTTAIPDHVRLHASVFPNPATDAITLQIPELGSHTVKIVDLSCQTVREVQGRGNLRISREDLPSGIYFAIIRDAEGVETVIRFVFE